MNINLAMQVFKISLSSVNGDENNFKSFKKNSDFNKINMVSNF